jgi:hypothetical protein
LDDRLFEVAPGRNLAPMSSKQKIDLAVSLVHGAIPISPFAPDPNVRFVHEPTHVTARFQRRNAFSITGDSLSV